MKPSRHTIWPSSSILLIPRLALQQGYALDDQGNIIVLQRARAVLCVNGLIQIGAQSLKIADYLSWIFLATQKPSLLDSLKAGQ